MDTIWLQESIWYFTAIDFLDFDFFPVKGETPLLACFAVIGTIASTTQKFVNGVRVHAIGHFIFELERIGYTC